MTDNNAVIGRKGGLARAAAMSPEARRDVAQAAARARWTKPRDPKAAAPYVLTREEKRVMKILGQAWNAFHDLPEEHPNEHNEFVGKIHDLQRMVMARPTRRIEKA